MVCAAALSGLACLTCAPSESDIRSRRAASHATAESLFVTRGCAAVDSLRRASAGKRSTVDWSFLVELQSLCLSLSFDPFNRPLRAIAKLDSSIAWRRESLPSEPLPRYLAHARQIILDTLWRSDALWFAIQRAVCDGDSLLFPAPLGDTSSPARLLWPERRFELPGMHATDATGTLIIVCGTHLGRRRIGSCGPYRGIGDRFWVPRIRHEWSYDLRRFPGGKTLASRTFVGRPPECPNVLRGAVSELSGYEPDRQAVLSWVRATFLRLRGTMPSSDDGGARH
jgi:hypothetical protein